MYNRLFFVVLGAALPLPNPAMAGVLLLTNPNQFSGQETLLTFEGVQPFQIVHTYGGSASSTSANPVSASRERSTRRRTGSSARRKRPFSTSLSSGPRASR
jgi:hypothetical protein